MALITRGNNMRLLRGGRVQALIMPGRPRDSVFSPADLFAAGEQGVWYDPSDFSTLFQDSVGTTPVTAIEQPVGRILDKSGRGNHASQSTTTSRLILRNLYNLFTYTEDFTDAAWTKSLVSATPNTFVAPDGTLTADTLASSNGYFYQQASGLTANTSYTASIYLYAPTPITGLFIRFANTSFVTIGSGANVNVTAGWNKFTLTQNVGANTTVRFVIGGAGTFPNGTSMHVWGASIVPTNEASLPYQRVVTNTLGSGVYDTDMTKFPVYLLADRTDDSYTTADGGGSTTGFFYCASILLQAAGQTHTLISDTGTNTGYRVRINSSNQLELSAGNGSAYTTATTTDTLSTGQLAVITAWHDGTKLCAQINNGAIAEQAFGAATAGTAALTIGKDNGAASSYFGGGIYAHVYLKNVSPSIAQREQTKLYCAQKAIISL